MRHGAKMRLWRPMPGELPNVLVGRARGPPQKRWPRVRAAPGVHEFAAKLAVVATAEAEVRVFADDTSNGFAKRGDHADAASRSRARAPNVAVAPGAAGTIGNVGSRAGRFGLPERAVSTHAAKPGGPRAPRAVAGFGKARRIQKQPARRRRARFSDVDQDRQVAHREPIAKTPICTIRQRTP